MNLNERLILTDEERYLWLEEHDTFLMKELDSLFRSYLCIRGEPKRKNYDYKFADQYFSKFPDLDYLIYSKEAPTKKGFKFVESSRIGFYRPGKSLSKWPRNSSFRFVWLKKQILSNFEEDYACKSH